MDGTRLPLTLPWWTLRLARRYWLPLLLWFWAGQLAYDLLIRGAVAVGGLNKLASLAVASLAMLAPLAATVLMLRVVRAGLPALGGMTAHAGGATTATGDGGRRLGAAGRERPLDAVIRALLPFVLLYGAWGLYQEDLAALFYENRAGGTVTQLVYENVVPLVVIAIGCLLLRVACGARYWRTGNRLLGVLSALLEAIWLFFAFYSLRRLIGDAGDWLTTRAVWVAAHEVLRALAAPIDALLAALALPPLGGMLRWLGGLVPLALDGLVLPVLWLGVAALAYGVVFAAADRRDHSSSTRAAYDSNDSNDSDDHEAPSEPAPKVPPWMRLTARPFVQELREKYLPLASGLRFVLRAETSVLLVFCACFVGIELLSGWGFVGVTGLIGPHGRAFWALGDGVLVRVGDMVTEVLRVCLLAVTFELVLTRLRERTADTAGTRPTP